jgi:hypothetical protein
VFASLVGELMLLLSRGRIECAADEVCLMARMEIKWECQIEVTLVEEISITRLLKQLRQLSQELSADL